MLINSKKTIANISDLHFEWDNVFYEKKYETLINSKISDILIVNGDLSSYDNGFDFIEYLLNLGHIVIFVLGNHDFYGHSIDEIISMWDDFASKHENFYFLNNSSVVIDDIEFFGSTLWTNVGTTKDNMEVPLINSVFGKKCSDFRKITNFNLSTMAYLHHDSLSKLQTLLNNSVAKYRIMCTHYLPSFKSIHNNFKASNTNFLFYSNLENFADKNKIDAWFHGHVHNSCSYTMDNKYKTHVYCNPRGSKAEYLNPDFSLKPFI